MCSSQVQKFALHTIFDLQGKQIAALRGSVFTTDFISYTASFGVSCNILYTEDNEAVMRAITRGDAVAGVCIYSLGNELAKKYAVAITPISFSPMALEFAVAKGKNADLIAGIDGLMAPMVGDPNSFYSRSYREWTLPSSATSIPIWIAWGLVGLIALGFFLIAWTFVLRRAVKQRTGELAKNEHKYRTLTESLPQMIFMKDPDSVYVSCNGHYAASLGIEPEDIVGKDDYAFYPRELAESYREGDRSVIKSGASATVVERWLRSGGETWVNTVKAPIWDEGGKIAGVIGIFWDVSDRIRLEKDRERSLREKEILLQEVNHRVKNNLQLISAMLRLEADESAGPEVENFVKATMSRITSIAVIHEMLYIKDDVAEIAIADYLREIGQNLAGMYSMPGRAVGIEIEAGDLRLDLNRMVPLGLITNEMMTNSLKYAFPGRESGTIAIAMSVDEASGQYVYGFMDDGIGLPASFDEAPAKRLGLTFIHSLALQLGGSITMKSGRGLEYELRFPVAGR